MATVRIVVEGNKAKIRSPFEAKDAIKTMPIRRWDPSIKCWVIPAEDVDELQAILEAEGFKVIITGVREQRRDPPPRNGRNTETWADGLFTALNPALAEKAYKALVRVIHPDVGGSTEAMKQLNAARDRHGQRA